MRKFLNSIRKPNKNIKVSQKIIKSIAILFLGIALGIFSKWLDNLALDDQVWWLRIIEKTNIGNILSDFPIWIVIALIIAVYSSSAIKAGIDVFLFYLGMCVSYHIYTVKICSFNPRSYMMIWYTITLVSPVLAVFCWYAKGNTKKSLVLCTAIFAVLMLTCFGFGYLYVTITKTVNILFFVIAVVAMNSKWKNTAICLVSAFIVANVCVYIPYIIYR